MADKAPLLFSVHLGMLRPANAASETAMREILRYDPATGQLFWLAREPRHFASGKRSVEHTCNNWNARYAGALALNHMNNRGYYDGHLCGVQVLAHRVIWALVHGEWPEFIDHINGDRSDNRLCNLRAVSRSENNRNRRLNKNNDSGMSGVKQLPNGRWTARLRVDSKNKWLGTFNTKDEAAVVRLAAEREHGFHANHGTIAR